MNLKNISRDAFWINALETTSKINFSTTTQEIATNGTVNQVVGSVASADVSGTGGNYGVGVLMDSNDEERTPYRVKAYVPTNDNVYIIVGYAPASPTGSDIPEQPWMMHMVGEFDEIIMLPATTTYAGRAIMFGIKTELVAIQHAVLSVQKLDVSPPQFAIAVP